MARLPRLIVPGYVHHVLQRGNDRQPIFRDPTDYPYLLALLGEYARRERVAVHGYVLMPDHFHLLLTPEAPQSMPTLMQSLGRRYVQYFNARHGRRGTLWEGRYRAAPLQAERHLLDCMAYLDLNPLRAGLAATPRDYAWSSHGFHVGLRQDRTITPHALYWSLGNTPFAREAAYAEHVRQGLSETSQKLLAETVLKGWALGDAPFVAELQARSGRRVTRRLAGRPKAVRE